MAYRGKLKITNISDTAITIEVSMNDRWWYHTIKAKEFLICDGPTVSFEELAEWEDKGCFKVQQYPKPLYPDPEPEPIAEIVEVSRFELMELKK